MSPSRLPGRYDTSGTRRQPHTSLFKHANNHTRHYSNTPAPKHVTIQTQQQPHTSLFKHNSNHTRHYLNTTATTHVTI